MGTCLHCRGYSSHRNPSVSSPLAWLASIICTGRKVDLKEARSVKSIELLVPYHVQRFTFVCAKLRTLLSTLDARMFAKIAYSTAI
jgi:hypothetical protein